MKTATIPPLRVAPELREAAENLLAEGETLSAFVEESLRLHIHRRQSQREFLARGIAALANANENDEFYETADIIRDLDEILESKRSKGKK